MELILAQNIQLSFLQDYGFKMHQKYYQVAIENPSQITLFFTINRPSKGIRSLYPVNVIRMQVANFDLF